MELGVRVSDGAVSFVPALLRACEFVPRAQELRYLDVKNNWQTLTVPEAGLAFTWCQTPVVMQLDDSAGPSLTIHWDNGTEQILTDPALPTDASAEMFMRSGRIRRLDLVLHSNQLFIE